MSHPFTKFPLTGINLARYIDAAMAVDERIIGIQHTPYVGVRGVQMHEATSVKADGRRRSIYVLASIDNIRQRNELDRLLVHHNVNTK